MSRKELDALLEQLANLFDNLPFELPLESEPCSICLGPEDIEDIGHSGALNRILEITWGYKSHGLVILQRGSKLQRTLELLRNVYEGSYWTNVFFCTSVPRDP
jgi:hypothetical protein